MDDLTAQRRSRTRFTMTAVGMVVTGMAGYLGFAAFVGSDRSVAAGVTALAAGTGFAAFFSPCSFPLLLTFLTRRSRESRTAAIASALRVAIGVAALLTIIALIMVFAGSVVGDVVQFDSSAGRSFRLGVGLLLVVLGLRQARFLTWKLGWLDAVAGTSARVFDTDRVKHPARRDFIYGFGYLLAGFG